MKKKKHYFASENNVTHNNYPIIFLLFFLCLSLPDKSSFPTLSTLLVTIYLQS